MSSRLNPHGSFDRSGNLKPLAFAPITCHHHEDRPGLSNYLVLEGEST